MSPAITEAEELFREIERYLSAVQVFRDEGCEPDWVGEASALAYASTE